MYFDGLSYRRTAGNMDQFFRAGYRPDGGLQDGLGIYRKGRMRCYARLKVDTGNVKVADEVAVKVGGKELLAFQCDGFANPVPAIGIPIANPYNPGRGDHIGVGKAKDQSNPPRCKSKPMGLRSYQDAVCRGLFQPIRVKHVVSKGVKADINNNLSERLQGTIRDRDKTLSAA